MCKHQLRVYKTFSLINRFLLNLCHFKTNVEVRFICLLKNFHFLHFFKMLRFLENNINLKIVLRLLIYLLGLSLLETILSKCLILLWNKESFAISVLKNFGRKVEYFRNDCLVKLIYL